MFDSTPFDAADEAYYARQAFEHELIPEDLVVGGQPEAEPAPTDAQLCADVASGSGLATALLSRLDVVDIDELDGEAAVDAAVAFDKVANRVAARRVRTVARAALQHVGTEHVDPIRLAAAEIGSALGLGSRSIDVEIDVALSLTSRLTATLAAMESGDVSYGKAKVLAHQTVDLFDEQAQQVEALVLGKAGERTWAQHDAAVRRAVVRVDPKAPERRRKNADRASRLVRRYGSDGLAELIVTLPVAQVDAAYTAADAWARARKAAGDDRPLEQLRAEAVARWATSFLTHGDPTTCDRECDPVVPRPTADPGADADAGEGAGEGVGDETDVPEGVDPHTGEITDRPLPRRTPTRHGRPLRVGLIWDLSSLLGLDDAPGELLDSGEVVSAVDMRALVARGIGLRRLLVDPETGELVDLTPGTWLLSPKDAVDLARLSATAKATDSQSADSTEPAEASTPKAGRPAHGQPMWLGVVVDTTTWQRWKDRTLTGTLATAVTLAPKPVRDLMDAARTDHLLDQRPDAEEPSAALSEFVAIRDRHPTNPTAAPTAAGAGDLDHIRPRSAGGPTIRANLHSPTRRFHVLRTLGGWRLRAQQEGGVTWVSPHGRSYYTGPHDYLGP